MSASSGRMAPRRAGRKGLGSGCSLVARPIGTSMCTGPGRPSVAIARALSTRPSTAPSARVKLALVTGFSSAVWSKTWWV